jgi:hypothetical protein
MTAKMFSKLLYLARLQGWRPERLPEGWPNSSWHTEVILQETGKYREGLVSKIDARGLSEALNKLATIEGTAVEPELYLAISEFINLLGKSAFLATEKSTGDTVMFAR